MCYDKKLYLNKTKKIDKWYINEVKIYDAKFLYNKYINLYSFDLKIKFTQLIIQIKGI